MGPEMRAKIEEELKGEASGNDRRENEAST